MDNTDSINYLNKYLKYKKKYINLKKNLSGGKGCKREENRVCTSGDCKIKSLGIKKDCRTAKDLYKNYGYCYERMLLTKVKTLSNEKNISVVELFEAGFTFYQLFLAGFKIYKKEDIQKIKNTPCYKEIEEKYKSNKGTVKILNKTGLLEVDINFTNKDINNDEYKKNTEFIIIDRKGSYYSFNVYFDSRRKIWIVKDTLENKIINNNIKENDQMIYLERRGKGTISIRKKDMAERLESGPLYVVERDLLMPF